MHNISSHAYDRIAVLIVAAGRGNRAPGAIPKQYRNIDGKTVLTRTLGCFSIFSNIIVVIHPDDQNLFDKAIQGFKNIKSVHGGASRTQSVKAGLAALKATAPDHVLIHDGARPFLSQAVIDGVLGGLKTHKAVAPALPIVDALKTLGGEAVDRDTIVRVQTPQGFHYQDILQAYEGISDTDNYADDIELAKHNGMSVKMCHGDENNIKLTYEQDFMQNMPMINISGSGFDVHRICAGKSLFLCGVEIEAGFSLKGHSDADVGLHALTDAILGAIAEGDIGDHFPPDNPKWKGVSSDVFLSHAATLLSAKNAILDHVDITLICEQPKISPHKLSMRQHIAKLVNLPLERVSVKATTTEGLGYTGRGEGIAATAHVSIRIPNA